MKIEDVLNSKGGTVKTVSRQATLGFIAELIAGLRIASVVIVDVDRRPLGIVTDRAIIRALAQRGREALELPAAELMESPAPVCAPSDSVSRVLRMMTQRRIRHVLVKESGVMVGIVSIGDLVKHQIKDTELENRVLRDIAQAKTVSAA